MPEENQTNESQEPNEAQFDADFERWASAHIKGFVKWLIITPILLLVGLLSCWIAFPLALSLINDLDTSTRDVIFQVQLMLIGLLAGCSGAYVRVVYSLPRSIRHYVYQERGTFFPEKLQLFVGMLIGVASYWLIDSRFIISIIYGDVPPQIPSPSPTGVGILAALTGLLSRELVKKVVDRID